MKLNKQILEAILRGINLAIDDFDDMQNIETQKVGLIKHSLSTRELIRDKWFVDLGLPSGTLWGKYNVGVDPHKLNKPEDWYGGYYAWGEIEEKAIYDWDTYKYANEYGELTKYCNKANYCDNGKPDNLTILQDEDDIAVQTNKLPWNVKMPTKKLINELLEYTTNKWVKNYQGISWLNGRLFTSNVNDNEIFIPAAGYRTDSKVYNVGSYCGLWPCSLYLTAPNHAHYLDINSSGCHMSANRRYRGFSIRPVLIK